MALAQLRSPHTHPSRAVETRSGLDAALSVLQAQFGYAQFRAPQGEIISSLIEGHDVLAVLPTGAGKSLCYQIPALIRPGLALIISPLIALMTDQVNQLRSRGIAAASLSSGQDAKDRRAVWEAVDNGRLQLLYLSPEALMQGNMLERLQALRLSLIAVYEAHCISQWGHDFRPEYRALSHLKTQWPDVPLIALTATADPKMQSEIIALLGIGAAKAYVTSPTRPNLSLRFERRAGPLDKQIAPVLKRNLSGSGIIYCGSRQACETTAQKLVQAGYTAEAYHAGLESDVRHARQARFQSGQTRLIVATTAFGMGIDKADVRFVIYAEPPASFEAYAQGIGRAGRDGKPAFSLCLYGAGDFSWALKRLLGEANGEILKQQEDRLRRFYAYVLSAGCRMTGLQNHFGFEAHSAPCGHCDSCQRRGPERDLTQAAQMLMSALYRFNGPRGRKKLIDHVLGKAAPKDFGTHLQTFGVGRGYGPDEMAIALDWCEVAGLIGEDLYDARMPVVALRDPDGIKALFRGDLKWPDLPV